HSRLEGLTGVCARLFQRTSEPFMPLPGKFSGAGVGLSTTATSLLFKLSRKMTQEEFLIELHRLCGQWHQKPYDFVHLPWAKLAVVNFISHEACASFFNMVKALAGLPGIGLTDVREALHQGLAANLGHFCAKCRQMSVYENAPLVFVDGATVPLALACQILVDSQLHAARSEPGARKQDRKGQSEA
ncbi:unnamed protein product, partial [Effrenium voratum]